MSLGGRIKIARKASGLSMRALAERIGSSAMAISKYEKGQMNPSSEALIRLANALSVKVEFFFRPAPEAILIKQYRKHASLLKKNIDAITAQVQDWIERYNETESFIDYQENSFKWFEAFKFQNLEEIEGISDALRRTWELGVDPIDNLTDILENKGVKIHQLDCNQKFSGCTFMQNSAPIIVVNSNHPGDRQRFSIAHELGHIVLRNKEESLIEKAANRFAGSFLLPKQSAYSEFGSKRTQISIEELHILKHKYGISMQAIMHRARDLKIISESYYLQFIKSFSFQGFRQKEPGIPYPAETPKRMKKILLRLFSEGAISLPRAEELLQDKLFEIGGNAIM